MALVGHISGSQQSNSLIAVSGTVIVANRPDALFPSALPGADVSFFVSGSRGGKGAATRTVSLFGGDAVVSGSLTVGTGSLTITSNDLQFSSFSNRIELDGSNNIRFYDAANPSGVTVASLATSSPAGSDTQVQFNDGGNMGADGGLVYNKTTDTLTAGTLAATGSTGLSLTGNATINGNIDTTEVSENKSIFASVTSNTYSITIGGGADVVVGGDLKVTGNDIKASDGTTALTLTNSTGDVTVAGDLTVSGNDVKMSGGTTALTFSGTGDVAVAGDLTVSGNDIKSSGGTTAITLSGANVILPGDLTVNGTTITADVTTVTVEDPLVALGFTSGSVAVSVGDRGFIGGLASENSVAMFWDESADEFAVARTTSTPNDTTVTVTSYEDFKAGVIKAMIGFSGSLTKLTDGSDYLLAGSGISISTGSSGAVTISSNAVTSPGGSDTHVQFNDGGSFNGESTFTYNKTDNRMTVYEAAVTSALTASTVKAGASSVSLFNDTATSISFGGSATSMFVGATNVTLGLGGVSPTNSTITASTGSFGRVVTTSTSTFGGATTHNGGISTTTFAASSTAQFLGATTHTNTSNAFNAMSVTGSLGVNVTNGVQIGGVLGVTGSAGFNGAVTLGDATGDTITFNGYVGSNILPTTDRVYNLGSPTNRWNNIYTGDLHLRNERGNWTVIEEETYLSIRNNHTGRMYKFVLEEIPGPLEPLGE